MATGIILGRTGIYAIPRKASYGIVDFLMFKFLYKLKAELGESICYLNKHAKSITVESSQ